MTKYNTTDAFIFIFVFVFIVFLPLDAFISLFVFVFYSVLPLITFVSFLTPRTYRAKSLQTPSNMLVINLAMMDFVMMLKTPVFIVSSFNEGPVWGKFGCDVYGLLGAFTGPGAAITNAMIAYDRYK